MMRPRFSLCSAGRPARSLGLAALAGALIGLAGPAAANSGSAKATYSISLGGYGIGQVNAELTRTGDDYSLAIDGYTNWLTSIVYKADASLSSEGKIRRGRVDPAKFDLSTTENGLSAKVRMLMRSGNIVALAANPEMPESADRVPVRANHRRNIVDPASAFLVAVDHPSDFTSTRACNRTLNIFDGWQRFDVQLSYKRVERVTAGAGSYSGPVIVCSARYRPVAGHRPVAASVQELQDNSNVEIWLAPLENLGVMIPYNIVIGTKLGDLGIRAVNLTQVANTTRASAE